MELSIRNSVVTVPVTRSSERTLKLIIYDNVLVQVKATTKNTHHLRGDFGDLTSNWFSSAAIVRHLELDRVSDLQVINIASELRKMKEQTSLPLAALDKAIGVLLLEAKNANKNIGKQRKLGKKAHTKVKKLRFFRKL